MGLWKKITDGAKSWFIGRALKKSIKRGVYVAVAWLSAQGLEKHGVTLDPEALTAAAYMGLEFARNYAKRKFPAYLGWL